MKTLRTKIIELENRPETNESASASETSTGNKVNVTPNDINKSDETNQISLENASTSAYNGQKLTPDNLNAPTADAPSQSRHQPMDRPNNSYPDRSNVAIDQVNLKANNLNGSSIEPETESSSQIESDTRDSISREEVMSYPHSPRLEEVFKFRKLFPIYCQVSFRSLNLHQGCVN